MSGSNTNMDPGTPWLSVAICTWNRCDLLRQTLEQLTRVRQPDSTSWELVIVNNNSTDQTEEVVRSFKERLPIRYFVESRPGVSYARNLAIAEARGLYILWIDDDVLVCEDWMAVYAQAIRLHPDHVLFGGPIEPWFPNDPPPWLRRILSYVGASYAMCDFGDQPLELSSEQLPIGANYAMRRDMHLRFPFDTALGRKEKLLLAGEETVLYESVLAAGNRGMWVPAAKVRHYIPPHRQNWSYFYSYYHGIGMTTELLRLRDLKSEPSPRFRGAPRWLWKHAILCEFKFWLRRAFCPVEAWIEDFKRRARAWGRIATYRRGKS